MGGFPSFKINILSLIGGFPQRKKQKPGPVKNATVLHIKLCFQKYIEVKVLFVSVRQYFTFQMFPVLLITATDL